LSFILTIFAIISLFLACLCSLEQTVVASNYLSAICSEF